MRTKTSTYWVWCAENIWNTSGFLWKWIRNYCFVKFPTSSAINLFFCLFFPPLLFLAEVAIYPHIANAHKYHKSTTASQQYFFLMLCMKAESLLFTMALQSNLAFSHSLTSTFVIITSDTLADAIGFKDPVPQVVSVQFINLLWIILIY